MARDLAQWQFVWGSAVCSFYPQAAAENGLDCFFSHWFNYLIKKFNSEVHPLFNFFAFWTYIFITLVPGGSYDFNLFPKYVVIFWWFWLILSSKMPLLIFILVFAKNDIRTRGITRCLAIQKIISIKYRVSSYTGHRLDWVTYSDILICMHITFELWWSSSVCFLSRLW